MASVFTFDPDPPRVSSPWSQPPEMPELNRQASNGADATDLLGGLAIPSLTRLEDHGIEYLESEPQLGSVEYKLHLLLRPRPQFAYSSTGDPNTDPRAVSGESEVQRALGTPSEPPTTLPGKPGKAGNYTLTASNSPSVYTRQNRLQHLTTQLKWRLQQSSPYHASTAADLVMANLPDTSQDRLQVPDRPGRLVAGIEESQGAMYEIGVNDDGALIGLTRDEMSESLMNLRAMAASLGCAVTILRAVVVGQCQLAPAIFNSSSAPVQGTNGISVNGSKAAIEDLLVVEALVLPDTSFHTSRHLNATPIGSGAARPRDDDIVEHMAQETEQLRVALTGSTTSGKSSLLGTLLASALDNARGKSRLNTLKHRHEIASGVTSSVAHELLGFQRDDDSVINYACDNVESWTDVHGMSEGGRLVLLTDSAGLPRFRRTIVRSLVAWKPHWTLCCIAAANAQDAAGLDDFSGQDTLHEGEDRRRAAQMLPIAYLELCLRLGLPLVVVITKYDLATKQGLKQVLSRVLDTLKAAGRVPQLLKPTGAIQSDGDLQSIPHGEMHEVRTILESVEARPAAFVPIVLTSAVTGAGMTKLHALLRQLPILPDQADEAFDPSLEPLSADTAGKSQVLFDIDEVYVKQTHAQLPRNQPVSAEQTFVLSGLLQRGNLKIGDELLLGPFSDNLWTVDPRPPLDARRAASYPVTHHEMAMRRDARFGPRRRRSSEDVSDDRPNFKRKPAASGEVLNSEWYKVRIASLRNLRLPVQTSFEGQAATVGITFHPNNAPNVRPRKGMVLLHEPPDGQDVTACGAFQIVFDVTAYPVMEPGAQFNVYVSSIRALVKVVSVGLLDVSDNNGTRGNRVDDDLFQLEGSMDHKALLAQREPEMEDKKIEVMFQLFNSREYMEIGAKALIMPVQAAEGSAGLEGYVGWINAVYG